MKRLLTFAAAALVTVACAPKGPQGVKDAFEGKFYIGTALNEAEIRGWDTTGVEIVKKPFTLIVAENCMKSIGKSVHCGVNTQAFIFGK
jgi:endo-1,4-beta-xylanase